MNGKIIVNPVYAEKYAISPSGRYPVDCTPLWNKLTGYQFRRWLRQKKPRPSRTEDDMV